MAGRKQTVTEKATSSDDKIKGLSLYFLQGRALRFDGFDWLEFAQGLNKLSDTEKLARLKELGRKFSNPKIAVYTEGVGDGGETVLQHQSMTMRSLGVGAYMATVPNLYKSDGPPEYEVCGVVLPARSWSTALHNEWDAFMDEQGLKNLTKEFNELVEQINEGLPSSEEIATSYMELPGLLESREKLVEARKAAYADVNASEEDLARLKGRITLVTAEIEETKAVQRKWSKDNSPFEAEVKVNPLGKKLKDTELKMADVYLEFVHRLAQRDGLTDEEFETWQQNATQQDRTNAAEVVATGNEHWTSGTASQAQTPEQKQKRAYDSLN